jgi:hypothetical protein
VRNNHFLMKFLLSLLLVVLTQFILLDTFGQKKSDKEYRPFSILIISPDSISLHDSLRPFIDTVESDFREVYYSYIEQLEIFEKLESEENKQKTKLKIQRAKTAEMDVHNTMYFQLIPMLTCSELWDLFNAENNHDFSFDFISRDELFSYDLNKISNYYEVDYVLSYRQISTPIENGEPVLKIEMELFGQRESKIIFEKISYGHSRFYKDNAGVLKACANDLQCLLESGVISSSADLFEFIKGRQKK